MKFLLDANMPLSAVRVFQAHGLTQHARLINLGQASDERIFEAACQQQAMLVTRDLDFGNPHLFNHTQLPGLVIIRLSYLATANEINTRLAEVLQTHSLADFTNAITVIEPARLRLKPIAKA